MNDRLLADRRRRSSVCRRWLILHGSDALRSRQRSWRGHRARRAGGRGGDRGGAGRSRVCSAPGRPAAPSVRRNLGTGDLRCLRPGQRGRHPGTGGERTTRGALQEGSEGARRGRGARARAGPGRADRGTGCRRRQPPFRLGRGRQRLRQHRLRWQCRRRRADRRGAGARCRSTARGRRSPRR